MIGATLPPLARALGARLRSLISTADAGADAAFVPAIALMDAADRAYRAAIESALDADDARAAVLEEMASFRRAVAGIRENAAREIAQRYALAGIAYEAFDPLDGYVPPPRGLSHADGVRIADRADRAKAEVAALRRAANDRIAAHVGSRTEAVIAAKRARNTAFAGALHAAAVPLAVGHTEAIGPLVDALAALADGWY